MRRGEEFLVAHRSPESGGYWHTIAGGVEPGEAFHAAAVRELREETGLAVSELQPLGEFAYTRESWEEDAGLRVHVEAFLVDVEPGWEPELNEEHDEYRWLGARRSGRAPFLARARRASQVAAVNALWHFSEDPSLSRFVPRDDKVWAIDDPHSWPWPTLFRRRLPRRAATFTTH